MTDFNDVAQASGMDAVRRMLEKVEQDAPKPASDTPAAPAVEPWPKFDGDISRFLDTEPPPRKWFVHNRLLAGRAAVLTGIGGASKTTALYHFALGAVLGWLPWDWKVDTTGTALLFLTEDTTDDTHHALADLCESLSDEDRARVADKLRVFSLAGEDVRLLSVDQGALYENARALGLIARCAAIDDVAFIGIDPALALSEGDELSQAHQRYLGQFIDKLAIQTGACAMLVTHATKASANADEITSHASRGGGGITDAVRAEFLLRTMTTKEATAHGVNGNDRKRYVQLVATKANKAPLEAFTPLWLERGRNGLLYPAELALVERQESSLTMTDRRVYDVLRELCKTSVPMRQEWRLECQRRGLVAGSSEDAKTKSMQRIIGRLLEAGLIKRGSARGSYIPTYQDETA
ncbi:MAG: AAA family ATPase [Thiobacillus sp.]|uniref:AAA family ATPase n=1 Tax=Thiobacillus sp. TaxID=924 RepID=UPI002893D529|nr:AAA family ATPase [Thiobacillus sp.]MDT3706493.1 AAA family ATPase [Thiobacillus sp.]